MERRKTRHKTLARIRIPLSETSDFEPDPKTNAFINLICAKDKVQGGSSRIVSHLRLNVQLEDGTILKGPIKKHAFKQMFDLFLLTAERFNNQNSKFNIVDFKLYNALKKRYKKQLDAKRKKAKAKNK